MGLRVPAGLRIPDDVRPMDESELVRPWPRATESRRRTGARHALRARRKTHALSPVPAGVPLSAMNKLARYLSQRRIVYVFPHLGKARWLVLEHDDQTYGARWCDLRAIAKIDASPRCRTVYAAEGVYVLEKRPSGG